MTTPLLSFLILDFNKPLESRRALESIRQNAQFPHQVIYLSNGGDQDYVWDFYKEGLIDRLIFNRKNNGLGYGTEDLFRFCDTEWAIYWQNDQELAVAIDEGFMSRIVAYLADKRYNLGAIGLAGLPCGENTYSERAHLINVAFYNSIPKTHGGCGPFNHLKYNEQCVQEYFKGEGLKFVAIPPIARDIGFYTIRELPCGGVVRQRTDTKSVRWIKPPKESYMFPEMTESEWADSIAGKWIGGTIPSAYLAKGESFNCWGQIES